MANNKSDKPAGKIAAKNRKPVNLRPKVIMDRPSVRSIIISDGQGHVVFDRQAARSTASHFEKRDPKKDLAFFEAEKERVEIDGRQSYFKLRRNWSNWMVAWITVLVLFNMVLTALVGVGHLQFEKYQWFVTAVTVETFLQIVGMGYVAVNYLFSDKNTK